MSFWAPESVRDAAGGVWVRRCRTSGPIAGLSTDTRAISAKHAFLALRGRNFDGHDFLLDAARAGAEMLIVESVSPDQSALLQRTDILPGGIVQVKDTGKALLRLAHTYRRTLANTRVIAVAGSNGKTTTTRLLDALLSTTLRGTASRKSFNNSIGVPLTILSAQPSDQYLICEVGTNAPGEIGTLGAVVEPDIAVITSIGREHLQGFGSLEGVAREELSLLRHLRAGGTAVLPADAPSPMIRKEGPRLAPNVIFFGEGNDADLRMTDVHHAILDEGNTKRMVTQFTINGRTSVRTPLLGAHNAVNATAAFAVARRMGIVESRLVEALARAGPADMRLELQNIAGITILNDSYNANPESMLAGLRTLRDVGLASRRRIAILGDMLELGEQSPMLHAEVLAAAADERSIDRTLVLGPAMAAAAARHPDSRLRSWASADDEAIAQASRELQAGDCVLLKGSRGMRLERLAVRLTNDANATTLTTAAH